MKICTICKKPKMEKSFYKDSHKRDGFRSCCKKCFLKRYKYVHSKKKNENWQKYVKSQKGIITLLINNAKDRAKRSNLPFDLDYDWVRERLEKGVCELSGLSFNNTITERYRANPLGASIDRIEPKKGYIKENCRLVCFCVNMAMSDWGEEILIKMAKSLLKNKNIPWRD